MNNILYTPWKQLFRLIRAEILKNLDYQKRTDVCKIRTIDRFSWTFFKEFYLSKTYKFSSQQVVYFKSQGVGHYYFPQIKCRGTSNPAKIGLKNKSCKWGMDPFVPKILVYTLTSFKSCMVLISEFELKN